ncbi:Ig-like domain-containing protein [Spirosoma agri]|uniref:DUF11 domain-containing protein n=1 Tax=Spirosoma agri TaxID=1987381 RepID=A0A6M0IRM9_9BACT|nr:Ig-like domain-containing protein [Spirosoma agri]NEU70920.1 DUF11 domain-containing protein [Spirosoma agri]
MKQKIYVLIIFSLALITNAYAQKGRFSVRFSVKSLDCATGKVIIRVDVKSSSPDSTFLMGDANYRFDYDSQIIRNPEIVSQENFANVAPASDSRYNPQNLNGSTAGPTVGTVSLNTIYGGSGTGAKTVGTDWITVSCIQFDIINTTLVTSNCFGLRWHTDTTFPITGMNEYLADASNTAGYRLVNVTSSKYFGNLQVCVPQYCSIKAVDDVNTTIVNGPVSGNVATNDADGPLVVTTTPITGPKNGTIVLNADGSYTYTPKTGYTGKDSIRYQVCKQLSPTVCDQAWLRITITGTAPGSGPVNLSLAKTVSNVSPALNTVISYSVVVRNSSTNTATGVAVKDTLPAGVVFESASGQGSYNATTGLWTVGTIAANSTATLVMTVKVNAEGTWFNKAQVSHADQTDVNSTPDNNNMLEDDISIACFAVPISFCDGDVYQLNLPSGYAGIQWFKDGQLIPGATSSTYSVNAIGKYTFTSTTSACPTQGCCPVLFVSGNCCKATACVPVVITRTSRGRGR